MSTLKILISQPKPENGKSPYYDIADKYGADITFRPFFRLESVSAREFRSQKINILDHSAIVFTSRKAMDHFFELSEELRITIPDTMKYFCISEQVANYLQKFVIYRKRKVFYPEIGNQANLIQLIHKHNKESYFIPLAEGHKNDMAEQVKKKNIKVSSGVMYRTVSNDFPEDDPVNNYDMVIFFSPHGVTALREKYPDFSQGNIKIGAFGPATALSIEEARLRLDISAPSEGCPSMVLALDKYLRESNDK